MKVAERNRGIYRRLKAEVESLREGGIYLSRKMQEEGANMMQRWELKNKKLFTLTFTKLNVIGAVSMYI